MTIRVQTITVDAVDPATLARWWAEAIGWRAHVRGR